MEAGRIELPSKTGFPVTTAAARVKISSDGNLLNSLDESLMSAR